MKKVDGNLYILPHYHTLLLIINDIYFIIIGQLYEVANRNNHSMLSIIFLLFQRLHYFSFYFLALYNILPYQGVIVRDLENPISNLVTLVHTYAKYVDLYYTIISTATKAHTQLYEKDTCTSTDTSITNQMHHKIPPHCQTLTLNNGQRRPIQLGCCST